MNDSLYIPYARPVLLPLRLNILAMAHSFRRTLITAALPYANGPKHIGHLAGAYLPADVYTRFLRSRGDEAIFICGSDEHGTAIPIQAIKEGTTPRAIIDQYHALLKENFEALGISFDIYHRTSEPIHHQTSQEIFLDLHGKGTFTTEESEQYFDEQAATFLADRYIKGTCPNCGHDGAFGDQCEKCGKSLSPAELINPVSTLSGTQPVLRSTKHWYLPLNEYEPWLREWLLEGHKEDWKPNTYGQCKSWIDGGLLPRAMTRDLDWGVPVPLPGADGKVLYVWFDAPIGYISATRQLFLEKANGKVTFSYSRRNSLFERRSVSEGEWETWWKDNSTRLLHFIGKDNIVFHCITFPTILKATGTYILPDNVPANEFLNLEGDKMSTSRQWSVEMFEYLRDFPDKPDVLRYCLLSNLPEAKDSEFTWKDYQTKNNSELVAILGNLVNRVVVLLHKFNEGRIPESPVSQAVVEACRNAGIDVATRLEEFRFRDALAEMMNLARYGNKLLTDTEPWKLVKTNQEAALQVLGDCMFIIHNLAILCEPFLPFTATALTEMLGTDSSILRWSLIGDPTIQKAGLQLKPATLLFQKIEDDVIQAQVDRLLKTKTPQPIQAQLPDFTPTPQKESISFEDFGKMDIRVGTILHAEPIPKASKLLKLTVQTGSETRTIVSGIAKYFSPEELIGKQVPVLINLLPREMMGVLSEGMILFGEDAEGRLVMMNPSRPVPPGSGIR